MKKDEIVRLAGKTCKAHGHNYLEHYQCYLKENPDAEERVGFLDIEASNLDADFGQVLSWCIKESGKKGKILEGVLTAEDIQTAPAGREDRRIVASLVEAMGTFDTLVTWYGARFDIPYIRTRASVCGVPFPGYGGIKHRDLWFVCRGKFKLSSNRLENACRVILGKTTKTRIDAKYWRGAVRGDKNCLDYVLVHNRHDVLDLEKIYNRIIPFARPVSTSI